MDKDTSLYAAIYEQLVSDIKAGKYDNGVRLPTEMELTQRYFVSRITAKRALNNLAEAGLVVRIPGRGTFLRGADPVCTIRAVKSAVFVLPNLYNRAGLEALRGASHCAKSNGITLSAVAAENEAQIVNPDAITSFIAGENPIVEVRTKSSDKLIASIGANAQKAVSLAIDRLEAAGHRMIIIFTMHSVFKVKDKRHPVTEFNKGLSNDIPDFDRLSAEIDKVLSANPHITAIVTCNSHLTDAVSKCLKGKINLSVIAISAGKNPARMGFSQYLLPMYEAGKAAIDALRHGTHDAKAVLLEPEYIERDSVKPV